MGQGDRVVEMRGDPVAEVGGQQFAPPEAPIVEGETPPEPEPERPRRKNVSGSDR